MLLVAKFFFTVTFLLSFGSANARDIYLLVLQEGISKNCPLPGLVETQGLYQIDLDGREVFAHLPFPWTDCMSDGVLLPLGQKMIKSGMADRVVFMPIGIAGTNVRDWLEGGRGYKKLKSALNTASFHNIKFDYALWQGRLISEKFTRSNYVSDVRQVIKSMSLSTKINKWLIGLSASCDLIIEERVPEIQWAPLLNRFPGPNIGALNTADRSDPCNVNDLGKKVLVQHWLRAMNNSDIMSKKYQKESLLYYFK